MTLGPYDYLNEPHSKQCSHVEAYRPACPFVFVKQSASYGGLVEITMAHLNLTFSRTPKTMC